MTLASDRLALSLEENAPAQDRDAVVAGLARFNARFTDESDWVPLDVMLRDETGAVVGGLLAQVEWNWLHVRILWIPDSLRGRGYGRQLMQRVESEARRRGYTGIHLNTFGFQARGFYEKLGYEVFGVLEDFPAGSNQYYLRKRLERFGEELPRPEKDT